MGSTNGLSTAEIFQKYAAFAWRALRHLGVREADAEDVCQEVFVIVHRKLAEFEGRSSVRTWLYAICLRVAKDYRQRAHIRYEQASADPLQGGYAETQEVHLDRARAMAAFERALEALDADKRAVFVLYEIEGLSMKEVAEAVGCPLQTAYSRLHAAREVILQAMNRLHGGEL
ncbi:MAG: sigma-70 family RNA polymerase sigma factor [Polyangiaceae bacterium]|nr:sigma-70 family RNA polymerase sigma factor [Polyangiaceae bacterium]